MNILYIDNVHTHSSYVLRTLNFKAGIGKNILQELCTPRTINSSAIL